MFKAGLLLLAGYVAVGQAAAKAPFFPIDSSVIEINAETFDKKVGKANQINYVMFYSPRNNVCKQFKDEWVKAASELKDTVNLMAVDCSADKELCAAHTEKQSYPVIKIFAKGSATDGEFFDGGKPSAKTIVTDAKKRIPKGDIEEQSFKQHPKWLAKHKKLPRAVLFTAKKDTPSLWRSMAMQFKGRVVFGLSRKADRKMNRKYQIKDFPSVIIVPVKDDDAADEAVDEDDDDEGGDDSFIEYQGLFTASAVKAWLDKYAEEDPDVADEPLAVEQLSDESCMKTFCVDAAGLCAILVVSVNPTKPDRRKLRDEVGVWGQVRDLRQDNLYNFAWIEGISQIEFLEQAVHMTPQDYPQVVVIAGRKLRYAPFVGAFSVESVMSFLNGVQKGSIPTDPMGIKELPPLKGASQRCKGMKLGKKAAKSKKEEAIPEVPEGMFIKSYRGHRGGSGAVEVPESKFDQLVLGSFAPWLVAFVSKESDAEFIESWEAAAKKLKNMVKFALIDCDDEEAKDMARDRYGVTTFPSIKVFKHGKKSDDTIPTDYKGESTTEAFVAQAHELLKPGEVLVPTINQGTLSPWVSHSPLRTRLLLFSDKEGVPDLLKALALEFEHWEINIGISNKDKKFSKTFNISSYPSIVLLTGEPGTPNERGEAQIGLQTKLLKLPKINYNVLVTLADELADMWFTKKQRLEKQYGTKDFSTANLATHKNNPNNKVKKKKGADAAHAETEMEEEEVIDVHDEL